MQGTSGVEGFLDTPENAIPQPPFPELSVIIPAFNCSSEIGALLDCILRTRVTSMEVIVVDDASTDETALSCGDRPQVSILRLDRNGGPARARNLGAARARGNILVFVDSDVLLPTDRDVLEDIVQTFRCDPGIDCICTISDVRPRVPSAIAYNNSIYHAYYMDRFLAGQDQRKGRIMFFTTRLGGIRADSFRRSGGFQDSLTTVMNEDGEFGARCYHLEFITCFKRNLVNLHRYPTNFKRFIRSYFLTALVQAQIDRTLDTSPDESISMPEKLRRLYAVTAFALPFLGLVLEPLAMLALAACWILLFLLSFGSMTRWIWRDVPWRFRCQWYLVYLAITPFIFAGYAAGVVLHAAGRSLIRDVPSSLDYFSSGTGRPG
jgi:glycosyltransferase involved in cell wall biosynthesis